MIVRGGRVLPPWLGADAEPEHVARFLFAVMPGYLLQRHVVGPFAPADAAAAFRALTTHQAGPDGIPTAGRSD